MMGVGRLALSPAEMKEVTKYLIASTQNIFQSVFAVRSTVIPVALHTLLSFNVPWLVSCGATLLCGMLYV